MCDEKVACNPQRKRILRTVDLTAVISATARLMKRAAWSRKHERKQSNVHESECAAPVLAEARQAKSRKQNLKDRISRRCATLAATAKWIGTESSKAYPLDRFHEARVSEAGTAKASQQRPGANTSQRLCILDTSAAFTSACWPTIVLYTHLAFPVGSHSAENRVTVRVAFIVARTHTHF